MILWIVGLILILVSLGYHHMRRRFLKVKHADPNFVWLEEVPFVYIADLPVLSQPDEQNQGQ